MKFCDVCNNMYYIKLADAESDSLVYYCRACGNESDDRDASSFKLDIVIDPQQRRATLALNKYSKLDPTLPRTTLVDCPACSTSDKAGSKRDIIYARTNAKDLTYSYMCPDCDKIWETADLITKN